MPGSFGRFLLVDLTASEMVEKELEEDVFRQFLGGKGLGSYLLLKMLAPGTDPLSAQNPLIFATGPATGTLLTPASRCGIFSKSPATGFFSESYSGGSLPPLIRSTGYDAIVITGASPGPRYISITDEGVLFYDASEIWGLDTHSAEEAINRSAAVNGAQAVVIGPAGERGVRFACIRNSRRFNAGRTGLGAVMGSKNLKGILFGGTFRAPVANEKGLEDWNRHLVYEHSRGPDAETLHSGRSYSLLEAANRLGCFPTRYWSEGRLEGWERINPGFLQEAVSISSCGCPGCSVRCGKLATVERGRHAGLSVEGPGYQTIYAFGGLCCLTELEEIVYLNDLCNRLGVDTISAGNLAAFAIEAGLKGRLSPAPVYGDADSIAAFLHSVVYETGAGEIFRNGIVEAAESLGMQEQAVHVKGLEPPGFDPRVLKGMALAYAVTPRGACHMRSSLYEAELSGRLVSPGVAGMAGQYADSEDLQTLFDCLTLCRFFGGLIGWKELRELFEFITGEQVTVEGLKGAAGRVQALARLFNTREGATRADDMLPPRFLKEPINGGKDLLTSEEMEQMVDDYYYLRGWGKMGNPPALPPGQLTRRVLNGC